QGLQPAVRVHALRDVSAPARREPPHGPHRGRREEVRRPRPLTTRGGSAARAPNRRGRPMYIEMYIGDERRGMNGAIASLPGVGSVPVRFWKEGQYTSANSGCAPAWATNVGGHAVLQGAGWSDAGVDGCITAGPVPPRTVAEVSLVDPAAEGSAGHRAYFVAAS